MMDLLGFRPRYQAGKDLRRKQALAVPRGHEDHQPLDLAAVDGLELAISRL